MVGFGPADLGSNPSRATSHIRNFINRLRFDNNMAIQNIAVLGAGQMGNGITQVAAAAGYNVTMIDICLLYTSPSPRDLKLSRMPSSA